MTFSRSAATSAPYVYRTSPTTIINLTTVECDIPFERKAKEFRVAVVPDFRPQGIGGAECPVSSPCNHLTPTYTPFTYNVQLNESMFTRNGTVPNKGPVGTATLVTLRGRGFLDNLVQIVQTFGPFTGSKVSHRSFQNPKVNGTFTLGWRDGWAVRNVTIPARASAAVFKRRLERDLGAAGVQVVLVDTDVHGGRKWAISFAQKNAGDTFVEQLAVLDTAMQPPHTPEGHGAFVVALTTARCKFDDIIVIPVFVDKDRVECLTPKLLYDVNPSERGGGAAYDDGRWVRRPAVVSLSYDDGQHYSDILNPPFFFYPVVHRIYPRRNSLHGGALVHVIGSGFRDVPTLMCRFGRKLRGEVDVRATFVGPTHITCRSPAAKAVGAEFIPLELDDERSVWVEVSVNGFIFSDADQFTQQAPADRSISHYQRANMEQRGRAPIYNELTYHVVPILRRVYPWVAPQRGGTPLKVFGRHFKHSGGLRCVFDMGHSSIANTAAQSELGYNLAHVKPRWVHSQLIVCRVPRQNRAYQLGNRTVQLRVVNNFMVPADEEPRRRAWTMFNGTQSYLTEHGTNSRFSPSFLFADASLPLPFTYIEDITHPKIRIGSRIVQGDVDPYTGRLVSAGEIRSHFGGRLEIEIHAAGIEPDLRKSGAYGSDSILTDASTERHAVEDVIATNTYEPKASKPTLEPDGRSGMTQDDQGHHRYQTREWVPSVAREFKPDVVRIYGGYVLAWQSQNFNKTLNQVNDVYEIVLQCFDDRGVARAPPFRANAASSDPFRPDTDHRQDLDRTQPSLVTLLDGFVVIWHRSRKTTSPVSKIWSVYGQRYNSECGVEGNEFMVAPESTNLEPAAKVVAIAGGAGFFVLWQGSEQLGRDALDFTAHSTVALYGQQYMWSGDPEVYHKDIGTPYKQWKDYSIANTHLWNDTFVVSKGVQPGSSAITATKDGIVVAWAHSNPNASRRVEWALFDIDVHHEGTLRIGWATRRALPSRMTTVQAASISTSGTGTGLALSYRSSNTHITGITVTAGGTGYHVGNTVTIAAAAMPGRSTDAVFILVEDDFVPRTVVTTTDALMGSASTSGGEDLVEPITAAGTTVVVAASISTSGSGTGLALSYTSSSSEITSITVTVGGTGYAVGDTLNISAAAMPGRSTHAIFTLVEDDLAKRAVVTTPDALMGSASTAAGADLEEPIDADVVLTLPLGQRELGASEIALESTPGGFVMAYASNWSMYCTICTRLGNCSRPIRVDGEDGREGAAATATAGAIADDSQPTRQTFHPVVVSVEGGFVVSWSSAHHDDATPAADLSKCPPTCQQRWVGDGFCDEACNVKACGLWDGGDCCAFTCRDGGDGDILRPLQAQLSTLGRSGPTLRPGQTQTRYRCGFWGYDCKQRDESTSSLGIYAKRFILSTNGEYRVQGLRRGNFVPTENTRGSEFRINTQIFGHQKNARLAPMSDGFAVVWDSLPAQRFDRFLNKTVWMPHTLQFQRFRDHTIKCRFGVKTVYARFVNETCVVCIVPPYHVGDTVDAEITNNGVDYSHLGAKVRYYSRCSPGNYCPDQEASDRVTADIIPCPASTFCPNHDTLVPTPCYPGTYNPIEGQDHCVPCPIGRQCPRYGMLLPDICPAGFVCDVEGIRISVKLCPSGHFCEEGVETMLGDCCTVKAGRIVIPGGAFGGQLNADQTEINGFVVAARHKWAGMCTCYQSQVVTEERPLYGDPGQWRSVPVPMGVKLSVQQGGTVVRLATDSPIRDLRTLTRRGWRIIFGADTPDAAAKAAAMPHRVYQVAYMGNFTNGLLTLSRNYTGETAASLTVWKMYPGGPTSKRPLRCPQGFYCGAGVRSEVSMPCNKFTRGSWVNKTAVNLSDTSARDPAKDPFCLWRNETQEPLRTPGYAKANDTRLCSEGQCYLSPRPCQPGYYCHAGAKTPRGDLQEPCPATKFCPAPLDLQMVTTADLNTPFPTYNRFAPTEKCAIRNWLAKGFMHADCSMGMYGIMFEDINANTCLSGINKTYVGITYDNPYCVQEVKNVTKDCSDALKQDPLKEFECDCPMGHYCPPEALAPVECGIGTYNDLTSQSQCLDCQSGFTCGEVAMVVMTPCRPGQICNEQRLTTERVKCGEGFFCLTGVETRETHCVRQLRRVTSGTTQQALPRVLDGQTRNPTTVNETIASHLEYSLKCDYSGFGEKLTNTPEAHRDTFKCGKNDVAACGRHYSYIKLPDIDVQQYIATYDNISLKIAWNSLKVGWVEIQGQYFDTHRTIDELRTFIGAEVFDPPQMTNFLPKHCPGGGPKGEPNASFCGAKEERMPNGTVGYTLEVDNFPWRNKDPNWEIYSPETRWGYTEDMMRILDSRNLSIAWELLDLKRGRIQLPCPAGYYCLQGVQDPLYRPGVATGYPQLCIEGTYCRQATEAASGSSPCPPGHYCPRGAADPILVSPGKFAEGEGNAVSTACFIGFYASWKGHAACSSCPKGNTCPSVQNDAQLMHGGRNDTIVCPAGRVCRSLQASTAATPCPSGHFCLEGTNSDCTQYIGRLEMTCSPKTTHTCRVVLLPITPTRGALVFKCFADAEGTMTFVAPPSECDATAPVNRGEPLEIAGVRVNVSWIHENDFPFNGTHIPISGPIDELEAQLRAKSGSICTFKKVPKVGDTKIQPAVCRAPNGANEIWAQALRVGCPICTEENHCINKMAEGNVDADEVLLDVDMSPAAATVEPDPDNNRSTTYYLLEGTVDPVSGLVLRSGVAGTFLTTIFRNVTNMTLAHMDSTTQGVHAAATFRGMVPPMIRERVKSCQPSCLTNAVPFTDLKTKITTPRDGQQPVITFVPASNGGAQFFEKWLLLANSRDPKKSCILYCPAAVLTDPEKWNQVKADCSHTRCAHSSFPNIIKIPAYAFTPGNHSLVTTPPEPVIFTLDFDPPIKLDYIQFEASVSESVWFTEASFASLPLVDPDSFVWEIRRLPEITTRTKKDPLLNESVWVPLPLCWRKNATVPPEERVNPNFFERCSQAYDGAYHEAIVPYIFNKSIYVNNTLWKDEYISRVTSLRLRVKARKLVGKMFFLRKVALYSRPFKYIPGKIVLAKRAKLMEQGGVTYQQDIFPSTCCLRPIPCPKGSYCLSGVNDSAIEYPQTVLFQSPQWCVEGSYCGRATESPQGIGPCPAGFYCPKGSAVPRPCWKGHECSRTGTPYPTMCQRGTYSTLGPFPPKTVMRVVAIETLSFKQYRFLPTYGERVCREGGHCCSKPCLGCLPPSKPDSHWRDCGYFWKKSLAGINEVYTYVAMTKPYAIQAAALKPNLQPNPLYMLDVPPGSGLAILDSNYIGDECALPYQCRDRFPEYSDVPLCQNLDAKNYKFGCKGEKLAQAERYFYGGDYDWSYWPKDDKLYHERCYMDHPDLEVLNITGGPHLECNLGNADQSAGLLMEPGTLPDSITIKGARVKCVRSGYLGSMTCPQFEPLAEENTIQDSGFITLKGAVVDDLAGRLRVTRHKLRDVQVSRHWAEVGTSHSEEAGTGFMNEVCAEGQQADCAGHCFGDDNCRIVSMNITTCEQRLSDTSCDDGSRPSDDGSLPDFNCDVFNCDNAACGATNSSCQMQAGRRHDLEGRLMKLTRVVQCPDIETCEPLKFYVPKDKEELKLHMEYVRGTREQPFWTAEHYGKALDLLLAKFPAAVKLVTAAIRAPASGVLREKNGLGGAKGGGRPLYTLLCALLAALGDDGKDWENMGKVGNNEKVGPLLHKLLEKPTLESSKLTKLGKKTLSYANVKAILAEPDDKALLGQALLEKAALIDATCGVGYSGARGSGTISRWPSFPPEFEDWRRVPTLPQYTLHFDTNEINVSDTTADEYWHDSTNTSGYSWHLQVQGRDAFSWAFAGCNSSAGPPARRQAQCLTNITQPRTTSLTRAYHFPEATASMSSLADMSIYGTGNERIYDTHYLNASFEIWFRMKDLKGNHTLYENGRYGWGISFLALDGGIIQFNVHAKSGLIDTTGLFESDKTHNHNDVPVAYYERNLTARLSNDSTVNFQQLVGTIQYSTGGHHVLNMALYLNGQFFDADAIALRDSEFNRTKISWSDGVLHSLGVVGESQNKTAMAGLRNQHSEASWAKIAKMAGLGDLGLAEDGAMQDAADVERVTEHHKAAIEQTILAVATAKETVGVRTQRVIATETIYRQAVKDNGEDDPFTLDVKATVVEEEAERQKAIKSFDSDTQKLAALVSMDPTRERSAAGIRRTADFTPFDGEVSVMQYYRKVALTPMSVRQNYLARTMDGVISIPYNGVVRVMADDIVGAASCRECPDGHYCPQDGTIYPIPCPPGKYKSTFDKSLECMDCPEGRFSLVGKLVQEVECEPCPEGKVCQSAGNSNPEVSPQTKTRSCPEGFFCPLGTTRATAQNWECPRGKFCRSATLAPNDFDTRGIWKPIIDADGKEMPGCEKLKSKYPDRLVSFVTLNTIEKDCVWEYWGSFAYDGAIGTAAENVQHGVSRCYDPAEYDGSKLTGEPWWKKYSKSGNDDEEYICHQDEVVQGDTLQMEAERLTSTVDNVNCDDALLAGEGCLYGTVQTVNGTILYGWEAYEDAPKVNFSVGMKWTVCGNSTMYANFVETRAERINAWQDLQTGPEPLLLSRTKWCHMHLTTTPIISREGLAATPAAEATSPASVPENPERRRLAAGSANKVPHIMRIPSTHTVKWKGGPFYPCPEKFMCTGHTGSSDTKRLANACTPGMVCPVNTQGPLPPQASDKKLYSEKDCRENCRPPLPVVSDQCNITITQLTGVHDVARTRNVNSTIVVNVETGSNDKFYVNVNASKSNKTHAADARFSITIPQGMYDLTSYAQMVQEKLKQEGAKTEPKSLVAFINKTGKVVLRINYPGTSVSFTQPDTGRDILGFGAEEVGPFVVATSTTGSSDANFNGKNVTVIKIVQTIVKERYLAASFNNVTFPLQYHNSTVNVTAAMTEAQLQKLISTQLHDLMEQDFVALDVDASITVKKDLMGARGIVDVTAYTNMYPNGAPRTTSWIVSLKASGVRGMGLASSLVGMRAGELMQSFVSDNSGFMNVTCAVENGQRNRSSATRPFLCCTEDCAGPRLDLDYECSNPTFCLLADCAYDWKQYKCPPGTTSAALAEKLDDCVADWGCMSQDVVVWEDVYIQDDSKAIIVYDAIMKGKCKIIPGDTVKLYDVENKGAVKNKNWEPAQYLNIFKTDYKSNTEGKGNLKIDGTRVGGVTERWHGLTDRQKMLKVSFPRQRLLDPLDQCQLFNESVDCNVFNKPKDDLVCTGKYPSEAEHQKYRPGMPTTVAEGCEERYPMSLFGVNSNAINDLTKVRPMRIPALMTATVKFNVNKIDRKMKMNRHFMVSIYVSTLKENTTVVPPQAVLMPEPISIFDSRINFTLADGLTFKVFASANRSVYLRVTVDIIHGQYDRPEYHRQFVKTVNISFTMPQRNSLNSKTAGFREPSTFVTVLSRRNLSPFSTTILPKRSTQLPSNMPRREMDGAVLSFIAQNDSYFYDGDQWVDTRGKQVRTMPSAASPGTSWLQGTSFLSHDPELSALFKSAADYWRNQFILEKCNAAADELLQAEKAVIDASDKGAARAARQAVLDVYDKMSQTTPSDCPVTRVSFAADALEGRYARPYNVGNGRIEEVSRVSEQTYVPHREMVPSTSLPFMGNCRRFGRLLPLGSLFEDPDLCDLPPPEEFTGVDIYDMGMYFRRAFVADNCDYQVQCLYNDFIDNPADSPSYWWWEPRQDPIFYLSKQSMSLSQMNDEKLFHGSAGADSLVPVITEISNRTGLVEGSRDYVPRRIHLKVGYMQKVTDNGTWNKYVLVARLRVEGFDEITHPWAAAGLQEKTTPAVPCDELAEEQISSKCNTIKSNPHLCASQVKCREWKRRYQLRVTFEHLGFWDLLGGYHMPATFYVMFALAVGFGGVFGVIVLWIPVRFLGGFVSQDNYCNRCDTLLHGKGTHRCKAVQLKQAVARVLMPALAAFILVFTPAISLLGLIFFLFNSNSLGSQWTDQIPRDMAMIMRNQKLALPICYNYIAQGRSDVSPGQSCLTPEELQITRSFRYAVAFLTAGMFAMNRLVPMFIHDTPQEDYQTWYKSNLPRLKKLLAKGQSVDRKRAAAQEITEKKLDIQGWLVSPDNPFTNKMSHMVFLCVVIAVMLAGLNDFMTLPFTKASSSVLLVVLAIKLMKNPFYSMLSVAVHEELLIAPFLVVWKLLELTVSLTSTTFFEFMGCYLFTVLFDAASRIVRAFLANAARRAGLRSGTTDPDDKGCMSVKRRLEVVRDLRELHLSLAVVLLYPCVVAFLDTFDSQFSNFLASWHHTAFTLVMWGPMLVSIPFMNDIADRLGNRDTYRYLESKACCATFGDRLPKVLKKYQGGINDGIVRKMELKEAIKNKNKPQTREDKVAAVNALTTKLQQYTEHQKLHPDCPIRDPRFVVHG